MAHHSLYRIHRYVPTHGAQEEVSRKLYSDAENFMSSSREYGLLLGTWIHSMKCKYTAWKHVEQYVDLPRHIVTFSVLLKCIWYSFFGAICRKNTGDFIETSARNNTVFRNFCRMFVTWRFVLLLTTLKEQFTTRCNKYRFYLWKYKLLFAESRIMIFTWVRSNTAVRVKVSSTRDICYHNSTWKLYNVTI